MARINVKARMYETTYVEVCENGDIVTKSINTPYKITNKNIKELFGCNERVKKRVVVNSVGVCKELSVDLEDLLSISIPAEDNDQLSITEIDDNV